MSMFKRRRQSVVAAPAAAQPRDTTREERIHNHFGHDVDAGPDCRCGHPRGQHVGSDSHDGLFDPPLSFFDGPCQVDGCACTPAGYLPGDGRPYAEVAPLYAPGWTP